MKAAVLDVISPDRTSGPIAAVAELLSIANECLNSFPNLAQNYDVRISHSKSILNI
jgi:eukaryotic translation initiation factor 2-alpha kinase 4